MLRDTKAVARECEKCHAWTYRKHCPLCYGAVFASELERLAALEEAGQQVSFEEYEKAYYGDSAGGDPAKSSQGR